MMKFLRRCFILLLTLIIVIDIGGSLYFHHVALARSGVAEDKAAVAQRMAQRAPFMASWLDSILAPSRNGHSLLLDTFITTDDGRRLHAWYLPAHRSTPRTAILLHGYGTQGLEMLHIGYLYHHHLGYNLLLPDLHAHGQSDGSYIRMGWLDRLDVLRWASEAQVLFDNHPWIVVHGISMGAATAMMLSGDELPEGVKAFVEDCGYTSVWDEFEIELQKRYGLPAFPLLHSSSALCRLLHGWSFGQASALRQVARCSRPMLFIHGDSDDFVPTSMARPLYEAHHGVKELWLAPEVGHADAFWMHPDEYRQQVRAFLGECETLP